MARRLIGDDECCHCGKVLLKYMMFLFNFLITLCGAALLGLGLFVYFKAGMSNAGIPGITINYNGCFVFMGFGGVMMLMGFLGCCGSICEISFMLKIYVGILSLIIIAELGFAIYVGIDHDQIAANVESVFNRTLSDDGTPDNFTEAIEDLQQKWQCCGLLNGCTDWENGVTHNCGCVPDTINSTTCVPVSNITTTAGCTSSDSTDKYIYSEGCYDHAVDYLEDNLAIYLGVAGGIIAFEIIAVIVACCVGRHIEYSKYDALA